MYKIWFFTFLNFFIMSTSSKNKTVELIIKIVIAVASALAGALGYSSL